MSTFKYIYVYTHTHTHTHTHIYKYHLGHTDEYGPHLFFNFIPQIYYLIYIKESIYNNK